MLLYFTQLGLKCYEKSEVIEVIEIVNCIACTHTRVAASKHSTLARQTCERTYCSTP